jgi:hypothetical protein
LLAGDVRRTVAACWGLTLLGGVAGVGSAALWSWQVALWVFGIYTVGLATLLLGLTRVRMEGSP